MDYLLDFLAKRLGADYKCASDRLESLQIEGVCLSSREARVLQFIDRGLVRRRRGMGRPWDQTGRAGTASWSH